MDASTRDKIITTYMEKEDKKESKGIDRAFANNSIASIRAMGDAAMRRSTDACDELSKTVAEIYKDPKALADWKLIWSDESERVLAGVVARLTSPEFIEAGQRLEEGFGKFLDKNRSYR